MLDEDYYSCECGYKVSVLDVLNRLVMPESFYTPNTEEIVCGECGNKYKKVFQVKKFRCPKCHGMMEEMWIEDATLERVTETGKAPQIMGTPYKKPIHSDALGIQPDQVAEHRKKFPNIELDNQNRPVFHNMPEHQDYMDKCGIVKQTSSNKKRGTIYSIPGTSCHRGRDLKLGS